MYPAIKAICYAWWYTGSFRKNDKSNLHSRGVYFHKIWIFASVSPPKLAANYSSTLSRSLKILFRLPSKVAPPTCLQALACCLRCLADFTTSSWFKLSKALHCCFELSQGAGLALPHLLHCHTPEPVIQAAEVGRFWWPGDWSEARDYPALESLVQPGTSWHVCWCPILLEPQAPMQRG